MNKKISIILLFIISLAIGVIFIVTGSRNNLSDETIRHKFDCSRSTTDSRNSDIYCENPELYRQHLKNSQENKNGYENCIKNSITEEQAQLRNFAGNVRDDEANPRTCTDRHTTYFDLEH